MPSADVLFEEFAAFSCIVDHALGTKIRSVKYDNKKNGRLLNRHKFDAGGDYISLM